MEIIKIVVEKTKNHYSAYAENVEGIYAAGNNLDEIRESVETSIRLLIENNSDDNIPGILKGNYTIHYKYDTASLLSNYKGIISYSGIERIAKINQRQIEQYASGAKKPRPAQREKIQKALHKLGQELIAVEL